MRRKGIEVQVWSRTRDQHGDSVNTLKGTLKESVFIHRFSAELDQLGRVTENPSLLNRVEARSEATVFSRDQSVPVTPDDYLVLPNGDRWEVAGIPRVWNAVFSNWRPGIEIPVRKVSA